jgi:hypothetical protein
VNSKILAQVAVASLGVALLFAAIRFANTCIAPPVFKSRLERPGEKDLPKITVEKGHVICGRMKADDFRFPLPLGSRATNLVVTGGLDTVDGSVEI